ncbi:MAG TPA: outer membrane beta-barrel protein [Edaphocola sp.]|nr:outer membrane beta-barrel protein [Edaphocola sp.]
MKKALLSLALVGTALTYANAQGSLGKGGTQLNLGLGVSGWGIPVYAGVDFGVTDDITVGIEGSYRSWKYTSAYRFSIIGVGANANYHFNRILELPEKMDLYAGVSLGYFIFNNPSGYSGSLGSSLGFSGQVGFRYFFTNKVGLQLEAGGGNVSGGKIGLTFKL